MSTTRIQLAQNVRAELLTRYRTRAEAETWLVQYLRGVVDMLGIPPEAVEGFDDTTGELLLAEGTEVPNRPRRRK